MNLLDDLNEPQKLAVLHGAGPLLVLAGAGSGKTRVITRRIAYLIEQGVAPWNVLAITFTNKAAQEMKERVAEIAPRSGAMVCTFHSLCARLLREFATEANLTSNYTIYDRDDQIKLVKQAMGDLGISTNQMSPQAVHAAISGAKNKLKTASAYADESDSRRDSSVAEVFLAYEKLLASNNALDFDDLLLRMAFLLRDRPEIRQALTDRYRHVLIDEYQDTNHAQYMLAHGIAAEHSNICATGDPDQSIYTWRGADISNILEFEADYPSATVIRLEENYRSTQAILTVASNLISHNSMRKDKTLWTRRTGGPDVKVITCDDEKAEARLVAQSILNHRDEGGVLADVAVFYRVNALSRIMEETLMRAGIPYLIARGTEFYNRKEIKDVLAYLKALINPVDDLSCVRIINTPARGIGATSVKRLAAFAASAGCGLLEACRRAEDAGLGKAAIKKVTAFAQMMDSLSADLERPTREIMESVVNDSGLANMLQNNNDPDRDPWSNVAELISSAAQFDESSGGEGMLADYLHQVSLVSDADHMAGSGGAVTLMTLHSAKGLEFSSVFMIGCEEGMLPFQRRFSAEQFNKGIDPKELEEERRLAFVGITRAKDELVMTSVQSRTLRGMRTPQAISRFVGELGTEGVELEDRTTRSATRSARRARGGGWSPRGGFSSDASQREAIESLYDDFSSADMSDGPPIPPEYEHLRKGSRVHHPMFGWGQVMKIGSQHWPETRVDVTFEGLGSKRLLLAKAKLELMDE